MGPFLLCSVNLLLMFPFEEYYVICVCLLIKQTDRNGVQLLLRVIKKNKFKNDNYENNSKNSRTSSDDPVSIRGNT